MLSIAHRVNSGNTFMWSAWQRANGPTDCKLCQSRILPLTDTTKEDTMSENGASVVTRRNRRNYATGVSGENKMAENVVTALVEKTGKTRGKNPRDIKYNVLNQVPGSIAEFSAVTGVKDEKDFCDLLYEGFNASQYSAASDEIGEFIPDSWDKETQAQFRLAVRNTSKLTGLDIENVVNMLKPAIEKALAAKAEAAQAETAQA